MKTGNKTISFLIFIICILVVTACANTSFQKMEYYSNSKNYIEVTGTINHISYDEKNKILYLGFSSLSETLDDNCFKIVEFNYSIIGSHSEKLLREGKVATFVTAPRYFGDGYIMPIVALTVDGCCLLSYDSGYVNFINWLKNK